MCKGLKSKNDKFAEENKLSSPAPVILGPVPRILWKQGINLVNKFALLFKRSMFAQDSRDKPENDWYRGRWLSRFSASTLNVILRRYSLPEVPGRRIHNVIANAMSICVAFSNKVMDTRLPQPVGCGDKYDVDSKNLTSLKHDICCAGRSMIEMLGVLAIIAVLSVGGIAGYSKAMLKWQVNQQMEIISELLNTVI